MFATSAERLLWIDTAGPWCFIAIVDGIEVTVQRRLDVRQGHGEYLLGEVNAALKAAEMTLADVEAIGVCTGPGGYAGLRVGIAAAQGLASGARKSLVGVPRSEAVPGGEPVNPVWAASEATRSLQAGVTGAKPIYPAPPDAIASTHQPAALID